MIRLALLALALIATTGCNAVVRGGRLSNRPIDSNAYFISTGGSPKKFRTVGFIQIRGYGVEFGGLADVGDAQLDAVLRGTLAQEASKMGGNGVINIEFYDENPSTDYERASRAASSMGNLLSGRGGIESKDRYVTVKGEVIQFLE